MVRASLLVAVLALMLAPANASVAARPLALHDLRAAVGIVNPRISSDGKHIVVVLRRADYAKDRYRNQLVLIDVATHVQTLVTQDRDDVGNASWSPSGDRIAFVARPLTNADSKEPPVAQLYVLSLGGGEPMQITHASTGVIGYTWRPDGGAFAYAAQEEAPNKKAIDAHEDAFEITDAAWTEREAQLPVHLWTVGAGGGKAVQLTSGLATLSGAFEYTREGRSIVFSQSPRAGNHYRATSLAIVDVADKRVRTVTAPERRASDPAVSPDGKHLAYAMEHPGTPSQTDIGFSDIDGAHARDLSQSLDRNVQGIVFAADGSAIYTGGNDGTRDNLYRIGLAGRVTRLPLGDANLVGGTSVSTHGMLAFVASRPQAPSELYVLAPGAKAPQRLTNLNVALAARAISPTRTIEWRSWDGFRVDGALTEPYGYVHGRKYPLVLLIHGGPTATSTTSFSGLAQLMAARGWFVFQPNYRGSDNFGARWAQATVPHITSAPARDCEEGLAAVLKGGEIDESRIGVSGWSEGGLMTSWLITHDTRWKAAMSGAAVNDWVQYGDMTDSKDFTPSFIGPSPWTSEALMKLYEDESPLTYAANVKTPTLIMTDAGDQRVPTPLDYEFYHAIRATGTPVEMVVFPRDGHNPTDPVGQEDRTRRWVEWFAQHL
jgi:dipeptidyl aminopeptidase/acylaminoacyl peptidase